VEATSTAKANKNKVMPIITTPLHVEGRPPSLDEVFGHDCIVLILYIQFALVSSKKKYHPNLAAQAYFYE
jgi:hypothetical protein